jgi:hypothetical protein
MTNLGRQLWVVVERVERLAWLERFCRSFGCAQDDGFVRVLKRTVAQRAMPTLSTMKPSRRWVTPGLCGCEKQIPCGDDDKKNRSNSGDRG